MNLSMPLPPSQIVPMLADESIYIASESTFYRVLRENAMNAERGNSKPRSQKLPTTHIASNPNEVWETKNATYSELLVRKALLSENIAGKPLVLHSDNGSPMKVATFLGALEKLGVQSSFSRPRVSNDNPYSEALFKTLKYMTKYPNTGLESLDHARKWVKEFVHWYNHTHYHSGLNFMTANDRHLGKGTKIMEKRKQVYARAQHPERWSKNTRNWTLPEKVALNPVKQEELKGKKTS